MAHELYMCQIANGQLSATVNATIFTANDFGVGATKNIINEIVLHNSFNRYLKVYFGFNFGGGDFRIAEFRIRGGEQEILSFPVGHVLDVADEILGWAESANYINYIISGQYLV